MERQPHLTHRANQCVRAILRRDGESTDAVALLTDHPEGAHRMSSWKKADLTQLSGAGTTRGRPFAYVTHDGSHPVPRVLYQGDDAHTHELRLEGNDWKRADLTDLADASDAAGPPFAYETVFNGESTPRVLYTGQDRHIHEIRLTGGAWKKADLTQMVQAPNSQGAPYACVTGNGAGLVARVVFRAEDGHIHEVRLEDGSWKNADLSERAGAEGASGDPVVYVTQDGPGQTVRVVYVGQDAHIHELHLDTGGSWARADLSARSGAPP